MPKTNTAPKKPEPLTTMQVSRDALQKMRVVATLQGLSTIEWLDWTASKAYEAEMRNRGRK